MNSSRPTTLAPSKTGNATAIGKMAAAPMASDASLVTPRSGGRPKPPSMAYRLSANPTLPNFQNYSTGLFEWYLLVYPTHFSYLFCNLSKIATSQENIMKTREVQKEGNVFYVLEHQAKKVLFRVKTNKIKIFFMINNQYLIHLWSNMNITWWLTSLQD